MLDKLAPAWYTIDDRPERGGEVTLKLVMTNYFAGTQVRHD